MTRQVALITGGSRGIGRAIAEELASIKYDLVLVAVDNARLKKAAAEIASKYNVKVDFCACDFSDSESADKVYDFCTAKKITPNVLVNNAGMYEDGTTSKTGKNVYDKVMSVNTRSAFLLTQKLLPLLKKGANSRIIIISSTWALDSYPALGREGGTVYSMSKWALRGWSRALREELRSHRIGVTIIYPGEVYTDTWSGTAIPKDRFIKPEDIGKAVRAAVEMSPNASIDEMIVAPLHNFAGEKYD